MEPYSPDPVFETGAPDYNQTNPYANWLSNPQQDPGFANVNPEGGGGLWNLPPVPYAPDYQSAAGMYSGIPMPTPYGYDIPQQSIYGYNTPSPWGVPGANVGGYQPGQYGTTDYNPASPWQVPGMGMPDKINAPTMGQAGYEIPDASQLMPGADWMQNFSPEIMQGLNAPWEEGQKQMLEQMGAMGQIGSPDAVSGAAGAAIGKFKAQQANQVGQQAWNMLQPGLQRDYQSQLDQAKYGAGTAQEANRFSAQAQLAIDNKWADMDMSREEWTANEQSAANKWETMTEDARRQRLADIGLDKGKFDAMNETDQSKYITAAQLSENTRVADQQNQQNQWIQQMMQNQNQYYAGQQNQQGQNQFAAQLQQNQQMADLYNQYAQQSRGEMGQENQADYMAMLNQQQQDYGMQQNVWNAQNQMAQFPFTALPGMMGGTYSQPIVNPGDQGGMNPLMMYLMSQYGG